MCARGKRKREGRRRRSYNALLMGAHLAMCTCVYSAVRKVPVLNVVVVDEEEEMFSVCSIGIGFSHVNY